MLMLYNNTANNCTIYPSIANNSVTAAQDTINNTTSLSLNFCYFAHCLLRESGSVGGSVIRRKYFGWFDADSNVIRLSLYPADAPVRPSLAVPSKAEADAYAERKRATITWWPPLPNSTIGGDMLKSQNLIPLTSGAYQARDAIANYLICENLFPEINPENADPDVPVTHYPREGKRPLSSPPTPGAGRGRVLCVQWRAFAVVGQSVYAIDASWTWTLLGTPPIPFRRPSPCPTMERPQSSWTAVRWAIRSA